MVPAMLGLSSKQHYSLIKNARIAGMIELNKGIGRWPRSMQATVKFNADGTPRRYRGNTVVCAVTRGTPLFMAAQKTLALLAESSAAARYALLPADSLHMTVIQLFSEEYRRLAWSSKLDADCSLEEADNFMIAALAGIKPPTGIRMKYKGIKAGKSGLRIELEPATNEILYNLVSYRNTVAYEGGVIRPDHDAYGFHVGLAYRIDRLSPKEVEDLEGCLTVAHGMLTASDTFELPAPTLTFFDNMFVYKRSPKR